MEKSHNSVHATGKAVVGSVPRRIVDSAPNIHPTIVLAAFPCKGHVVVWFIFPKSDGSGFFQNDMPLNCKSPHGRVSIVNHILWCISSLLSNFYCQGFRQSHPSNLVLAPATSAKMHKQRRKLSAWRETMTPPMSNVKSSGLVPWVCTLLVREGQQTIKDAMIV